MAPSCSEPQEWERWRDYRKNMRIEYSKDIALQCLQCRRFVCASVDLDETRASANAKLMGIHIMQISIILKYP